MQRDKKYYFRWETCMRCDKRCRKQYFFGREGELKIILCDKCARAVKQKERGRIYTSRRSVEQGYAIRRAAAAH